MPRPGKKQSADPARNSAQFLSQSAGACVRSGHCCKAAPCPFGEWNEAKTQCAHLEGDRPGRYACGIYDRIVDEAGSAEFGPAFGAGCCQPMNTDRRVVHLERTGSIDSGAWPR